MSESRLFFVPSVADIDFDLTVVQDPHGMFGGRQESRYNAQTMPLHLHCRNSQCQQGGVDLVKYVYFNPSGENDYHCDGHEGTPKGRRIGDPCGNSFKLMLVKRS